MRCLSTGGLCALERRGLICYCLDRVIAYQLEFNHEPEGLRMKNWWKKAVVYQVYPRSFMDSDGDGIGDLRGITGKLDHIADLGVDVVWLSPVYKSGGVDAGYDISDYYQIEPEFGTMADFDELLVQAHRRNLKIIMDLVVNHTSDKHPWFIESRGDRTNPRRDYYIWRDGHKGQPPNQMIGYFSEPVWQFDAKTGQYYMHLFAVGQPDLNWENKGMREEIYTMMNWWLKKGIDGFRMDVINCISKPAGALVSDGGLGMRCENGPLVHEYIREMNLKTFSKHDVMTVGETPGASPEDAIRYAGIAGDEVNMVFQFELMRVDHGPFGKWTTRRYNLLDVKEVVTRWQEHLYNKAWNSQYLGNHDQPRCVSRWGDDSTPLYWEKSAKMLCTFLFMLQGTPYVYQGDELGMTNVHIDNLSQVRDVESRNAYQLYVQELKVLTHEEMMKNINAKGRDNARTPMQWTDQDGAGFTGGEPWIMLNDNYQHINARQQADDPNSILSYFKQIIRMRKLHDIITDGEYKLLDADNPSVYTYLRESENERLLVLCNFTAAVLAIFSAMCAWALVRNKTKWSTVIFMFFVAAMVIPFQVVMFPLVKWFRMMGDATGIRLLGTYQGIVFAYLGFGCSMSIFILHGFIKSIPMELEEAATIDGCNQARTFFEIVVPLLQPTIITVLILNGIWIWNDYLLPLLILGSSGRVQTIPLAVTAFAGSYLKQWDLILTSALLAMLPIIVLYLFAQKYIIKGMVEGAIK